MHANLKRGFPLPVQLRCAAVMQLYLEYNFAMISIVRKGKIEKLDRF